MNDKFPSHRHRSLALQSRFALLYPFYKGVSNRAGRAEKSPNGVRKGTMQALLQAVQKGAECGKNGYFRAVSKNSQIVKFPQPDFCILLPRFFGLHKRTNVLVYLVAISIFIDCP